MNSEQALELWMEMFHAKTLRQGADLAEKAVNTLGGDEIASLLFAAVMTTRECMGIITEIDERIPQARPIIRRARERVERTNPNAIWN